MAEIRENFSTPPFSPDFLKNRGVDTPRLVDTDSRGRGNQYQERTFMLPKQEPGHMGSEEALLKAFIKNQSSPSGKWLVEVPVGLGVQKTKEDASLKFADAICLTERSNQLPEKYPGYQGHPLFDLEAAREGTTRSELFRNARSAELFNSESAVLVEAKSGNSTLKAVGQLQSYKKLLSEDYGISVDQRVLLSASVDPVVDRAAKLLGIRRVTP